MNFRHLIGLGAGIFLMSSAMAGAPTPAQSVQARKANFNEMGAAMKAIGDELRTNAPDMNAVRSAARDIASRSGRIMDGFPKGSGPQPDLKTRARPEIWTQRPDFLKLQQQLTFAANDLVTASAGSDQAAIARARAEVGAVCKSCHERFRASD